MIKKGTFPLHQKCSRSSLKFSVFNKSKIQNLKWFKCKKQNLIKKIINRNLFLLNCSFDRIRDHKKVYIHSSLINEHEQLSFLINYPSLPSIPIISKSKLWILVFAAGGKGPGKIGLFIYLCILFQSPSTLTLYLCCCSNYAAIAQILCETSILTRT